MKKLNQIITSTKIEYGWKRIKMLKRKEAFLKKLLNRVIIKTYQHRKKAEELSLYYETISGYWDNNSDKDDLPCVA